MTIQEMLVKAIRLQWPTDTIAPGLVIAFLPDREPSEQWYVSIARYPSGTKLVVQQTYRASLEEALDNAAANFVAMHEHTLPAARVLTQLKRSIP